MSITRNARLEIALAVALTVVGIVLTAWAVLSRAALLVAPGALLITIGGAWLGNAMARHGVRLISATRANAAEGEG
jgi:hypothetical protein